MGLRIVLVKMLNRYRMILKRGTGFIKKEKQRYIRHHEGTLER